MTKRFRLDWENMQTLPRKKRHDGATREDLANRKFNIGKAHHKGRNHISNQKRRALTVQKRREGKQRADETKSRLQQYKTKVAAFWRGDLEEHP